MKKIVAEQKKSENDSSFLFYELFDKYKTSMINDSAEPDELDEAKDQKYKPIGIYF